MKKIVSIAAVCLLCLVGCGSAGNSPQGVVEQFYAESAGGNIEGALELFTAEKRSAQEEGLAALAEFRDILVNNKFIAVEILKEEIEENRAKIFVKEKYEIGDDAEGNARLVLEDGEWKIEKLVILGRGSM